MLIVVYIDCLKQYVEANMVISEQVVLDSIVVSIPACHAGDRGSIPRRGEKLFFGLKDDQTLNTCMFPTNYF